MRDITALANTLYGDYKDGPIPYAYAALMGQTPSAAAAKAKANQVINGKKPYLKYWLPPYGTGTGRRLPYTTQFKSPWWCDCIGWIRILCLYDAKVNPLPLPKSNTNGYVINGKNWYNTAAMDISANQMRANYGGNKISTLPEPKPDKAIFVSMEGHIGLYVGNGWVIEQTPVQLQKTKFAGRGWTSWGYIPTKWRDFIEVTVGLGKTMDVSVKGKDTAYNPQEANAPAIPTDPDYENYTVVKGDTLWEIANKTLNNGNRFREILFPDGKQCSIDNRHGGNGWLKVGETLLIPRK